ncbi:MAG: 1-deoxy-D-xylulose-5-phosphate reductoisomerase, partial [Betaproteobacteria bacterium]|nr:1-deoxy-D-xylulose-5-phosphate reductoisomerase [Betaproteobacteria bacterium]
MKYLTILGSTGSVGVNTLDVVARNPGRFELVALTARSQIDMLFEQSCRFKPRYAVVLDEALASRLHEKLRDAGVPTEVLCGVQAMEKVA